MKDVYTVETIRLHYKLHSNNWDPCWEMIKVLLQSIDKLQERCGKQNQELNDLFSASVTIDLQDKEIKRLVEELAVYKKKEEQENKMRKTIADEVERDNNGGWY